VAENPDIPVDLIGLRLAFLQADAECARIAARMPTGMEIRAGIKPDEQDTTALADARARRLGHTLDLFAHPWWNTAGNRVEAEQRLRAAAASAAGSAAHE
jgi:hypothetical protein